MGHRSNGRVALCSATAALLCIGAPVHGVLPLVVGLGKQIVQNMLIDGVKSQLVGALGGMGCKGAALASLVPGSGGRSMPGMPTLPGAGWMPALPGGMPIAAGAMPGMGSSVAMPAARGGVGILNAPAGTDPRSMDMSQLMAMAQQQMGSRMANMPTLTPEQMAQMNSAMAAMQQSMAQPLSPAETKAVFDELATLGVMTPEMHDEADDCITLAGPSAASGLGASAALMKNMVLPRLREARERMASLSPDEREQMASEIAQAMKDASPEDRKMFQEGFGVGFFPPDVVTAVRSKLR